MISRNETKVIGSILKTHGINGEVVVNLDYDINIEDLTCLILDIDGILVPFFADSVRKRSADSLLIKFDGIDNENQAAEIVNHDIYALISELDIDDNDEGFYVSDLIGYEAFNGKTYIGRIDNFDDSTENALFIVKNNAGDIFYIPVTDEFITAIDEEKKIIEFDLPEGILDL